MYKKRWVAKNNGLDFQATAAYGVRRALKYLEKL
jgi:hypothetical protein